MYLLQVHEHVYFTKKTIEERLLLWRSRTNEEVGDADSQETGGLTVLSGENASGVSSISTASLRYLIGLSDEASAGEY